MKYDVTIRAIITKTYTIEAASEDEAAATANDKFELTEEYGVAEEYIQETIEIHPTREIEP